MIWKWIFVLIFWRHFGISIIDIIYIFFLGCKFLSYSFLIIAIYIHKIWIIFRCIFLIFILNFTFFNVVILLYRTKSFILLYRTKSSILLYRKKSFILLYRTKSFTLLFGVWLVGYMVVITGALWWVHFIF